MQDYRKVLAEMLSLYVAKHPEAQKEAGDMVSNLWKCYYSRVKGGSRSSAAKTAAVRENGKKGGRPRKKPIQKEEV